MHDFLRSDVDIERVPAFTRFVDADRVAADAAERFPELAPILDVVEHELNALYEADTTPEGEALPRAYHRAIERMAEMLTTVRLILADRRAGAPAPAGSFRPASVVRP